jgi:hypothetical protein
MFHLISWIALAKNPCKTRPSDRLWGHLTGTMIQERNDSLTSHTFFLPDWGWHTAVQAFIGVHYRDATGTPWGQGGPATSSEAIHPVASILHKSAGVMFWVLYEVVSFVLPWQRGLIGTRTYLVYGSE